MADTTWLEEYEATNVECAVAKALVALEPSPRTWPFYRDAEWNPSGYQESPYPTEKIPTHN